MYHDVGIITYFRSPLRYSNLRSKGFLNMHNHRKKFFWSTALSFLQYSFPRNISLTSETKGMYSVLHGRKQNVFFAKKEKKIISIFPGYWIRSLFYMGFMWMESCLDELSKINHVFVLVLLAALIFLSH